MKIQKIRKNQVWLCKLDERTEGHVQGGTRPVVIVSNDMGNYYSNICTVVPCTSQEKTDLPTHCFFTLYGNKNTILTEQITTIDRDKLIKYIGTLDDELAESVNESILISLGMINKPKSDIHHLVLQDTDEIKNAEVIPIEEHDCDTEKSNNKLTLNKLLNKRGRKPKFNNDYKIRYVADYENHNHNIDYMCKKYNESSKRAVSDKVYRFRKEIKENS